VRTNGADADAKACGPGLPTLRSSRAVTSRVTTGAIKPGSRGERAISVKTIAQGRPDVSAYTCGSFPVHFLRTGAAGAGGHPAFPAPSVNRRVQGSSMTRTRSCRGNAVSRLGAVIAWRYAPTCLPKLEERRRKQSRNRARDSGLLRGACRRAALCADPLARNDGADDAQACHCPPRRSEGAAAP
jgi:hypothetical protein